MIDFKGTNDCTILSPDGFLSVRKERNELRAMDLVTNNKSNGPSKADLRLDVQRLPPLSLVAVMIFLSKIHHLLRVAVLFLEGRIN